jgi:hypothetical protein
MRFAINVDVPVPEGREDDLRDALATIVETTVLLLSPDARVGTTLLPEGA